MTVSENWTDSFNFCPKHKLTTAHPNDDHYSLDKAMPVAKPNISQAMNSG